MSGAVITLLLASALPLPFTGADSAVDRGSWVTLVGLAVAGVCGAVALTRRRRLGWALAVGAGLLAAQSLGAGLVSARRALPAAGPAAGWAFAIGALGLASFVVALGCCLSLRSWRAVLR